MLIEVWYNLKYYYSFRYPKANFVFQFFHTSVLFWVRFPWATLSHFLKKQRLRLSKNEISTKTYETVSTSNFLTQFTVHYFLYVHIRFRTFRIATRPNWNNYYNITNVPTTLYLSQMKRTFWLTLLPSSVHKLSLVNTS